MPLRLRLALFGAAVVALALLVFGLLLYALLARGVSTNQDDLLRTRARQAAQTAGGIQSPQAPVAPTDLSSSGEVFVELMTPNGDVLYTTGVLNGSPPQAPASLLDTARQRNGAFATRGSLRLYVLPYANGFVMTGQSTRVPQSNLSGIVVFLIVSAIPALIAALLASWLVAGRALAPLRSVAQLAGTIGAAEDMSRMRLPSRRSRDEVGRLTESFNAMLDRLQAAFESQRRFVADASHELRTPLTTIQGNAGLLARGPILSDTVRGAAAHDIVAESARMSRLIDRMLTLARADAGLRLELAPIDLKSLVEEVGRQAAALHTQIALTLETEAATVDGDEDAIRQLVWILLDNAFRYARSVVELRIYLEPGWARLVVADDGPGIAVDQREKIFERFYRAEPSRTGNHSGLGLSIARWIAGQHGGRIVAGEATAGGAAFLVDLPLLRTS